MDNLAFSTKLLETEMVKLYSALATYRGVMLWESQNYPIMEVIDNYNPSFIFLHADDMTNEVKEGLAHTKARVVLFGLDTHPRIDLLCIPSSIPNGIADKTAQKKMSCRLQPCSDIVTWRGGFYTKKYSSDVLVISDNLTYYELNIINTLKRRVKIVGNPVPSPYYVGTVSTKEMMNLVRSANVCLDFNWSHALDFVCNNRFTVSNMPNVLTPHFSTVDELEALIDLPPAEKDELAYDAYIKCIQSNTNFHLASYIFNSLGAFEEVEKIMQALGRHL